MESEKKLWKIANFAKKVPKYKYEIKINRRISIIIFIESSILSVDVYMVFPHTQLYLYFMKVHKRLACNMFALPNIFFNAFTM